MTPNLKQKIKPHSHNTRFLTIFDSKKHHENKYTVLSFNRVMGINSNVFKMLTVLYILLKISINNYPSLYIHINTHK